ncbi:hypothetical protein FPOAC2_10848 [Fusarium poae]
MFPILFSFSLSPLAQYTMSSSIGHAQTPHRNSGAKVIKQIITFMVYICYYQIHLNRLMASKRLPIQVKSSFTDLERHISVQMPTQQHRFTCTALTTANNTSSSANFGIIE